MNSLRTFFQIRKRVKQHATRYSLLVVMMLFGLFLEAYMHNFNLVYITLFFVFASAFAAGPMGVFNIGRLEAEFAYAGRLFANENGQCFFSITNQAHLPSWAIELHCDDCKTVLSQVAPDGATRAALSVAPEKRGWLESKKCYLQSFFPLSTVRFVVPITTPCRALVYPQPKGEPLRTFLLRQQAPFGDEKDFDGLSPYDGAQAISRIHWPSVAKGDPSVKHFEQEMPTQKLIFDFHKAGTSTEGRLSQLCLWVLECEKSDRAFAVRMPHAFLESEKEGIDAILEHLALY